MSQVWHVKEVCACGASVEQDCHSYGGPETVRRDFWSRHYPLCPLNTPAIAREAAQRACRKGEQDD